MNRRVFLSAVGAVATQQKLSRFRLQQYAIDSLSEQPSFTVTRFPYVQNVRNDRAAILWATAEPGVGQVRYSADGVNFRIAAATRAFFSRTDTGLLTNYYQYHADLTGLSPDTL